MEIVNAGTTPVLTLSFEDHNRQPVVPTSALYWVIDEKTGAQLSEPLEFFPVAADHELVIPAEYAAILQEGADYERKRVVVSFSYGGAFSGTGYFTFTVRNPEIMATLAPYECLLEGFITTIMGQNAFGVRILISPVGTGVVFVDNRAVSMSPVTVKTDNKGFFWARVLRDVPVRVACPAVKFSKVVTLTQAVNSWEDL